MEMGMNGDTDPRLGITGPTSLKESSAHALQLSTELEKYLRDADFFESEASAKTRERVLGRLDFLVKQFVADTAKSSEDPRPSSQKLGGKIFTFGSYRLGVHDKGADIDALCVVPRHVHRRDFFTVFYSRLQADPNVTELSKVEEAYVPLIKMKFSEIPIDLTFSRLSLPVVRDNISLLNDSLLKSMDEKCIVSLNGSRVTDALLGLVPSTAVFHAALRAIKFWAKRRFVYGASFGYFGGVAFAISVARICQMYPKAAPYDIIARFFETYTAWKWPAPVMLRNIVDLGYHHLKVWDSKLYPSDKYHKMPVITPAYPSMCSTHNITQSTCALITSEFTRAHEIIKAATNFTDFSTIFDFSDFFKRYRVFVELRLTSESAEEGLMWNGFIESKVRVLSTKLEGVEGIVAAVPFPRAFKKTCADTGCPSGGSLSENNASGTNMQPSDVAATPSAKRMLSEDGFASKRHHLAQEPSSEDLSRPAMTTSFFIGVEVFANKATGKKFYINGPIEEFRSFVCSWENKTEGMQLEITAKKKKEVQAFVREFYRDEK